MGWPYRTDGENKNQTEFRYKFSYWKKVYVKRILRWNVGMVLLKHIELVLDRNYWQIFVFVILDLVSKTEN
jgi:hypothetical protein